jgi:hypothetical protein
MSSCTASRPAEAWDPGGDGQIGNHSIGDGIVLAATDVALALPARATVPPGPGAVGGIWIAASAGEPARSLRTARLSPARALPATGTPWAPARSRPDCPAARSP